MGHYSDIMAKRRAEELSRKRLELKRKICRWADNACVEDLENAEQIIKLLPALKPLAEAISKLLKKDL